MHARASTTRPSPTTPRRSGSTPRTPRRTTTAATPGSEGGSRQGHRRLHRGDPARSQERPRLSINRGDAWQAKGDIDKAIADYTEAIRLDPRHAQAYDTGATPGSTRGISTRPSPTSPRRSGSIPRTPSAYSNRGNAWYNKKEFDKAIADYTEAIRLDPEYAMAYNNRGRAWQQKGEFDKAIADYTEAIRLDPKDAAAYSNRGNAWATKKDFDQGHRRLQRGDPARPRDARAYITEAMPGTRRGSSTRPSPTTPRRSGSIPTTSRLNSRGYAWYAKHDYDKAIADYAEVIRLDPEQYPCVLVPRQCLVREGEYDKAIADYTEAIRLDPKNATAYNRRGSAWQYSGGIRQGHRRLQRGDPARSRVRAGLQLAAPGSGPPAPTPSTATASGPSNRPPRACDLSGWKSPRRARHAGRRLCRVGRLRRGREMGAEGARGIHGGRGPCAGVASGWRCTRRRSRIVRNPQPGEPAGSVIPSVGWHTRESQRRPPTPRRPQVSMLRRFRWCSEETGLPPRPGGARVNSQPVVPPPAAPSRPMNWGSESLVLTRFFFLSTGIWCRVVSGRIYLLVLPAR